MSCFKSQLLLFFKVSWVFTFSKSADVMFWKSADCLSFESQLMLCFEGKLMLFFKISWLFMFSKLADIMFWKSADCLSFSESANCLSFESQLTIQLIIYFSKVSWYHGVTESQLIVNVTVKSPFYTRDLKIFLAFVMNKSPHSHCLLTVLIHFSSFKLFTEGTLWCSLLLLPVACSVQQK